MSSQSTASFDPTSILNHLDRPDAFSRDDERDDAEFYGTDRFVQHLDSRALSTVEDIIGRLVDSEGAVILDLMAGWDSHIPGHVRPARVVGLGMNERELESNRALDERVIHDLNADPALPFEDDTFDAVINTVSVDYMTRPFEVFAEAGRVLKPGGLFLVIFSNRWFPQKAVKIWKEAMESERIDLVREFFERAGAFDGPEVFISMGRPRPEDDKYALLGIPSDPIFAVYAYKKCGEAADVKRSCRLLEEEAPIDWEEAMQKKKLIKETLLCPYCGERLKKWKLPDDPCVEWNNEYMYICFNDSCPYFVRGWKTMFEQGNTGVSYRLMYNPDNDCTMAAPVYSCNDMRDGIVEED